MYKFTISVLGSKGGSGKTTTSHLLSLGLAKYGIPTVLMTTDHSEGRVSLSHSCRPYTTYDAKTVEDLARGLDGFKKIDVSKNPAVLVVDGGGNRIETDDRFAEFSDLIILPFKDSDEDIRVVSTNMLRLSSAYALPTAWPTNSWAAAQALKNLDLMRASYSNRIWKAVPACRATQQLLRDNPGNIDSQVVSISKTIAYQAMSALKINLYQNKSIFDIKR